eukprot:gene22169-30406_t
MNEIRKSCQWVVNNAENVSIDEQVLKSFAEKVIKKEMGNSSSIIEWDTSGWHFCEDVDIFVLDALNFCFWPCEGFEYEDLAIALKIALSNDKSIFSGEKLASLTEEIFLSWFSPSKLPPNVYERLMRLHELGNALVANFDGLAINMVKAANNSGVKLAELILMYLPGFRDTAVYRGRLIHFYKRAQILVADIWGAFKRLQDSNHPWSFNDMAQLTTFADYRVPQILRQEGILRYSQQLAEQIDALKEIPFGSVQEQEIRACTIVAVEQLYSELGRLSAAEELNAGSLCIERDWRKRFVLELDWLLWQWGEQRCKDSDMPPHHRTNTIYY